MSAWPQSQQQPQQQQQNGIYPGMLDASNQQSMFDPALPQMYGGGGGTINPSQFNNPQFQQRMSNGTIHSQNTLQNQTYNVGQVIPSKRSRDEGAVGMSPATQNMALNTSRSQTPLQPGTPYQAHPGQGYPTPYQHLQQSGSANASPSPTMQNQQYRPPAPPQRMTTQSPANFTTSQPQMSPGPNQQSTMSMSPQSQQQTFSPTLAGTQGFGQQFQSGQGMMQQGVGPGMNNMNHTNMNMTPQMQAHLQQQRQYQQQLLQQQQRLQASQRQMQGQMNNQVGAQMNNQMVNQMGGQMPNQMNNQLGGQMNDSTGAQMSGQMPGRMVQMNAQMGQNLSNMQPQQQPQQHQQHPGQTGPQLTIPQAQQAEKARLWHASLKASLQQQGKEYNPNPIISGRPISMYMIWACIIQAGGSARVSAGNGWPTVAAKLGFNSPTAAQELHQAFEIYLSGYEKEAIARAASQRNAQATARQMAGVGGPQPSPTRAMSGSSQDLQQGPNNQLHQQQMQQMHLQRQMQQQIQRQGGALVNDMAAGAISGQSTPVEQPKRQESIPPHPPLDASPAANVKPLPKMPNIKLENVVATQIVKEQETEYIVNRRANEVTHGGYDVQSLFDSGTEISMQAQDSIRAQTTYIADIRTITMSLESGIPSEVRYAIDTLVELSSKALYWKDPHGRQAHPGSLALDKCDDLLETILDRMEEHVDLLASNLPQVSNTATLESYEQVSRLARAEQESLRLDPDAGTLDFETLHIADRLIAMVQILSNMSMDPFNQPHLACPRMVTITSNIIRLFGTRDKLLRSYENTLDMYKILITLLSNISSAKLSLESHDEALHFTLFLLAFAPQPGPITTTGAPFRFVSYNPAIHRYLPLAVDTFAKLLARQEPNRAQFRDVFTVNSGAAQASARDLFTQAFAMSVSFLPDRGKGPLLIEAELNLLRLRKAYFAQGLLAADILSSLIPAPSSNDGFNIAKAWLEADSAWPSSLLRVAFLLSTAPKVNENLLDPAHRPVRRDHTGAVLRDRAHMPIFEEANDVPGITAHRGLGMLHGLIERAMASPKQNKAKSIAAVIKKDQVNGTSEDAHTGHDQDAPAMTNGGASNVETADEESEIPLFQIKGDPVPTRETITALLGAPQPVETDALRMMDKIYDLFMPRV